MGAGDIMRGLRRALRGDKGRQVLDRAADRAIGRDDDPRTRR